MKNYHFKIIFIIFFLIHTIKSEKDCSKCKPTAITNDDELKYTLMMNVTLIACG